MTTLEELRTWIFATRSDIAEVLKTDVRTVGRAIEMGQIPAVRISDSTIRIPVAAFLRQCVDLGAEPVADINDLENSEAASATDTAARSDLHPLKVVRRDNFDPPAA